MVYLFNCELLLTGITLKVSIDMYQKLIPEDEDDYEKEQCEYEYSNHHNVLGNKITSCQMGSLNQASLYGDALSG